MGLGVEDGPVFFASLKDCKPSCYTRVVFLGGFGSSKRIPVLYSTTCKAERI